MTADQGGPCSARHRGPAQRVELVHELLTQHPQVSLSLPAGKKELHFFDPFLTTHLPTHDDRTRYRELFHGHCAWEFTPGYLRWPWVPDLVQRVCGTDLVLFVLLRDPVDRFLSLLRNGRYRWARSSKARADPPRGWITDNGTSATWGGMYAQHLRILLGTFRVAQFCRAVRGDGARSAGCDRAGLGALGVDPTPRSRAIDNPSQSSITSGADLELREALRRA